MVLDGDELRCDLTSDLCFSQADRKENMRRTAEIAGLLNQSGIDVMAALVSPNQKGRDLSRTLIGMQLFVEVFVSTPLAISR